MSDDNNGWIHHINFLLTESPYALIASADGNIIAQGGTPPAEAPTPEELLALYERLLAPPTRQSLELLVGGIAYHSLGRDETLHGRKDRAGVIAVKSNTLLLLATYSDIDQAHPVNNALNQMKFNLEDNGY